MTLEELKDNTYFDKKGRQIFEGDLLKVYHFRSGRKGRKIHYMYHVVVMEQTRDFPVMAGRDYYAEKPHYRLYVTCNNDKRTYRDAEIIATKDWETKRLRIKP